MFTRLDWDCFVKIVSTQSFIKSRLDDDSLGINIPNLKKKICDAVDIVNVSFVPLDPRNI